MKLKNVKFYCGHCKKFVINDNYELHDDIYKNVLNNNIGPTMIATLRCPECESVMAINTTKYIDIIKNAEKIQ